MCFSCTSEDAGVTNDPVGPDKETLMKLPDRDCRISSKTIYPVILQSEEKFVFFVL